MLQDNSAADGQDNSCVPWMYSEIVKEHFFNPQNFTFEPPKVYSGLGLVGSPACGDMMKVWITVDEKTNKIKDFKWQTFGCASAIASTSMLSVMATENGGLTLDKAEKLTPQDILERLGGLPDRKVHCSVLGDQALRAAIEDYRGKSK
ncbi:MAG: iron-sulfur cluster assembly scaffold protein [Candidatus Komeilibacteria bacterium]|nr:iron-sulfur cluster assembly scaffold protein [Candidatus Komeilibacteria bacterium]